MLRALVRVGDDERHRLAGVVHDIVLQREEAHAGRGLPEQRRQQLGLAGDRRQVLVREDRHHSV